jgi:uncharacterized protein (DUF2141 family)
MKTIVLLFLVSILPRSIYPDRTYNRDTYALTVEVNNLRNAKGVVQFVLYNAEGSIPDEKIEKYYRILKSEIIDNSTQATFAHLPPGKYAVTIFHDENRNGKIDKGLLLPKEGIGFSNYQSIGMTNRPSFIKASFEIRGNAVIVIKIIYL